MTADNEARDSQLQMQKLRAVLEQINAATQMQAETATDPVAAENAVMQRASSAASMLGLPPDQMTGMVPNMAPLISGRQKKQAQGIYEQAEKTYGPEAMANDAITLQTEQFGPVKPSQLRAMFSAPAIDASGAPASPKAARALQIMDLGGRKMAVDPTQLQHGQTFQETPTASSGTGGARFWVIRNGQPMRITEAEYQPGDLPASNREQGRPVTSGDAGRMTDLDTSLSDLNTLETELGTTGAASKIGAMLPNAVTEFTGWGSDAKQRQAVIDRVKQVIGKALEGGVLRKEDEYKYVKILPTIGDPPEVAAKKLQGLRAAIEQRRQITLDNLGDAGFDTSKFGSQPTGEGADPLGLFK